MLIPLPACLAAMKNRSTEGSGIFTINLRSFLREPARSSMWKPKESLDDYVVTPPPEVIPEPPRPVWLRRTGEIELLRPLAPASIIAKPGAAFKVFRRPIVPQPLWFRRFLVVGSGALVMMALVLVSAILVSISDPASGPDVAEYVDPAETSLTGAEEPFSLNLSSSTFGQVVTDVDVIRSNAKRWSARRSFHRTVTKPVRPSRPLPQIEQSDFVPTTLVIYAKNGVVYSRIEPWFQSPDKKIPSSNN